MQRPSQAWADEPHISVGRVEQFKLRGEEDVKVLCLFPPGTHKCVMLPSDRIEADSDLSVIPSHNPCSMDISMV